MRILVLGVRTRSRIYGQSVVAAQKKRKAIQVGSYCAPSSSYNGIPGFAPEPP
jgi:hypothetical protein